ncbi:MAG: hypothetical protein WDA60_00350 [Acidimicrobiia bacterium]
MNGAAEPVLPGTVVGAVLPRFSVTVSAAANARYWQAAGVDHPLLRAGALYPPIAANLVVLTVLAVDPAPLLQTRQALRCHRRASAPAELWVDATVTERSERRGRRYTVVTAEIATADGPLWTAASTFTGIPS